jgi:hypothetical protein
LAWRQEPPELRASQASVHEQQDAEGHDPPVSSRFFLTLVSILMSILFLILVIGNVVPALVLHPCD